MDPRPQVIIPGPDCEVSVWSLGAPVLRSMIYIPIEATLGFKMEILSKQQRRQPKRLMPVMSVLHLRTALTSCSPVLTILFAQSREDTNKTKPACAGNVLVKG